MKKKDIARQIADKHGGISLVEAADMVNCILDCLADGLEESDKVLISGFGTFKWKGVQKRKIILPNGTETSSRDRKRIWFQPAQALKDRLNQPEDDHES